MESEGGVRVHRGGCEVVETFYRVIVAEPVQMSVRAHEAMCTLSYKKSTSHRKADLKTALKPPAGEVGSVWVSLVNGRGLCFYNTCMCFALGFQGM